MLFFARGIDAGLSRRFLGGAQLTQDIARDLFERLKAAERLGIDHDEEMAEVIRLLVAVFVAIDAHLEEAARLQRRGENLNDGCITVALVAREVFADAAQEQAPRRRWALEDRVAVRHGAAVTADDHARRGILAGSCVIFDLAALADARGTVQHEGELLIRGHADGEGVGAEHVLYAEGRRDAGTRVGAGDADHALVNGHAGPVARDAVVRAVADGGHRHAVLFAFFDDGLHRLVARDHAHAVVCVHNKRGGRFLHNLVFGDGFEDAGVDAVEVDGFLKAVAAVAFDAAAVALQQNIRADFRVLQRDAVGNERVDHKALNHVPRDIRSGLCHKSFCSSCFVWVDVCRHVSFSICRAAKLSDGYAGMKKGAYAKRSRAPLQTPNLSGTFVRHYHIPNIGHCQTCFVIFW